MDKEWHLQIVSIDSTLLKGEIFTHAITQMDFEDVMLSEVNHTEKKIL